MVSGSHFGLQPPLNENPASVYYIEKNGIEEMRKLVLVICIILIDMHKLQKALSVSYMVSPYCLLTQ